jgi:conjugal transfer pilus assembly protein TraU
MKKLLSKLIAISALILGFQAPAHALVPPVCTGQFVNPITHVDWNNMYPITIAGARLSASTGTNPPLMDAMPPVCVCPTIFGIPLVGIGITYWSPQHLVEIENRPGCLSTLGGINVLPRFSMLTSEMTGAGADDGQTSHMQIHSYFYPVFEMLDMMESMYCRNPGNFDLGYMTEIDPTWQDDLWAAVFAPESGLFANPVAQAACAVDAAAAEVYAPLDALFWCQGTWGATYPLTGNSGHMNNGHAQNNQVLSKFLSRNARLGLEWQTIGPTAICFSHPNPILIKSQYRYNQVLPMPRRGRPVVGGGSGLFQFPPVSNLPTQEFTATVIWQGKQCCAKAIP